MNGAQHILVVDDDPVLREQVSGWFCRKAGFLLRLPNANPLNITRLLVSTSAITRTLRQNQLDGIGWRTKPTWYIVAAEDRAVHPDLQRFCSKRMGATTVELKSSHVPMLSQPRAVLDVIRNASAAVAATHG